MKLEFQFKQSNGNIKYVGFDTDKKVYSTDYYANVGLFSAHYPMNVNLALIKALIEKLQKNGYNKVTYLVKEYKWENENCT